MAGIKKKNARKESPLDQMIRSGFEYTIDHLKPSKNPELVEQYDLTGEVLQRRKDSAQSVLPQIQKRYGHYYRNQDYLTEDFVLLCTTLGFPHRILDQCYYTGMVSAIWMLDELEQTGSLQKVRPYLPTSEEASPGGYLPAEMLDLSHDVNCLCGLTFLIRHRNQDSPDWDLNPVTAGRNKPVRPSFSRPGARIQEMSWRDRFNEAMRQIRTSQRKQAVQAFEDKFWQLLDDYFSLASLSSNRMDQIMKEFSGGSLSGYTKPVSVIRQAVFRHSTSDPSKPYPDGRGETEEEVRVSLLRTEFSREGTRRFQLANQICMILDGSQELPKTVLTPEDLRALRSFEVEDPYEICFGYLCLTEDGSDLPWIYPAAEGVLLAACSRLPWAISMMPDMVRKISQKTCGSKNPVFGRSKKRAQLDIHSGAADPEQRERSTKLYQNQYSAHVFYAPDEVPLPDRRLNLAQLIYGLSGYVVPRQYQFWIDCQSDLVESGVEPELAQGLELCVNFLNQAGFFASQLAGGGNPVQMPPSDEPDVPDPEDGADLPQGAGGKPEAGGFRSSANP